MTIAPQSGTYLQKGTGFIPGNTNRLFSFVMPQHVPLYPYSSRSLVNKVLAKTSYHLSTLR